jgi:hypothetical protein
MLLRNGICLPNYMVPLSEDVFLTPSARSSLNVSDHFSLPHRIIGDTINTS